MGLRIHSGEPFSGLQIGEELVAYGTEAASYMTVPLVGAGETLRLRRDQIAPPRVYGGVGSRETFEYGRSAVEGSFQTIARFDDADFFHILLAHTFWGETVLQDYDYAGAAIASTGTGNTHIYAPLSVIPSMSIRVWKGGIGPAATGYWEIFLGCMIQSMQVEFGSGTPIWTFNFIGQTADYGVQASTIPAVAGSVISSFRDISRTGAYFKIGGSAFGIDTLRINYDNKLVVSDAYITSPDTADQPGRNEERAVTLEIAAKVEQDFYSANKPAYDFAQGSATDIDLLLLPGVAVGDQEYGMRFEFPNVYWDTVKSSLSDPAEPDLTGTATAIVGDFDATGGLPDSQTGDARVLATVKVSDERATDTEFSQFYD